MPLYGPRAGAAFDARRRQTLSVLTGDGPTMPVPAELRRMPALNRQLPRRLLTERNRAQLATLGEPRTTIVPWTGRDTSNLYALRVVGSNRGRGPKSYRVDASSPYAPIPDAQQAPGGLTGALSRVVDRLAGRSSSGTDRGGCTNCGG